MLEKELESSPTKYQKLRLFLRREVLGPGAGGEWRLGLAGLGKSSDVSLTLHLPYSELSPLSVGKSAAFCHTVLCCDGLH